MNSAVIKKVMCEMGRKGGLVGGRSKSPARVSAVRENGRMGGRPKKSPGKLRWSTTRVLRNARLRKGPSCETGLSSKLYWLFPRSLGT